MTWLPASTGEGVAVLLSDTSAREPIGSLAVPVLLPGAGSGVALDAVAELVRVPVAVAATTR